MTIKKAFVDIIKFLEGKSECKVKTILSEVKEMASAKRGTRSETKTLRNAAGQVTHIFCYYHQKWESLDVCEFGIKASSSTGYNNMCKEGASHYTKAVREAGKANTQLLEDVKAGKVSPGDIATKQAEIEAASKIVVPRKDGLGYESLDDVHENMKESA